MGICCCKEEHGIDSRSEGEDEAIVKSHIHEQHQGALDDRQDFNLSHSDKHLAHVSAPKSTWEDKDTNEIARKRLPKELQKELQAICDVLGCRVVAKFGVKNVQTVKQFPPKHTEHIRALLKVAEQAKKTCEKKSLLMEREVANEFKTSLVHNKGLPTSHHLAVKLGPNQIPIPGWPKNSMKQIEMYYTRDVQFDGAFFDNWMTKAASERGNKGLQRLSDLVVFEFCGVHGVMTSVLQVDTAEGVKGTGFSWID